MFALTGRPPSILIQSAEEYGAKFSDHLLEQYKLYVQSAQQVSDRRAAANNNMLTLNSTLVTLYGIIAGAVGLNRWLVALPVAGLVICAAWHSLIQAYRNLNSAKFRVIHELECHLPAALFSFEKQVGEREASRKYKPLAQTERIIPFVFALLYLGLAAYTFWGPLPIARR